MSRDKNLRSALYDALDNLKYRVVKAQEAVYSPDTKLFQMDDHLSSIAFQAEEIAKGKGLE